ncbi:hypothetical protein N836_35735 [Leptolyngbya sp. Heron Island J]|uniref:hypothetical protein n=1 Tax=Leptolyngbya sp. Heron Island J TaxID=1385935 RepID=UPI0003B94E94|nr:hypothetical protein [Leptolyngbya sp. Heron Island J]ESA37727.1 hypothetical protein N836_35735 [Leptolyngbya sp. Heron Island J]
MKTQGLWVVAEPQIRGVRHEIRVAQGLFNIVADSAKDYLAKKAAKPAGHTKLVKIAHCVALLQGTPAVERSWRFNNIASDCPVGRDILRRCWTDYMAQRDGIVQLELDADASTNTMH